MAYEGALLKEGTNVFPDGTRIVVEYADEAANDNTYGDVEEHEAEHATIAVMNGTPVIEASVIPEGNSLGHVQMAHFDPIAASTSKGRAGNGHDRMITEMQGHSFEASGSVAHGMIRRYKKEVRAVARALQKEKRLSGASIEKIIANVKGGEKVKIHIYMPDGTYRLIERKKKDGNNALSIKNLPTELPKPANDSGLPKAA